MDLLRMVPSTRGGFSPTTALNALTIKDSPGADPPPPAGWIAAIDKARPRGHHRRRV